MKSPGQEEIPGSLAEELGRRRVSEVRESSGRLPPKAKYWLPSDGITAASAFKFLHGERKHTKEISTICDLIIPKCVIICPPMIATLRSRMS